jgi:hypothetical protein
VNSRSGVGIIRSANHGLFYEPIPDRNREPSILLRIGPTNRKIRLDRNYRRWRLSGRNCFALVHCGIVSAPMTRPQNGISFPRAGVVPFGSLAVAWCRPEAILLTSAAVDRCSTIPPRPIRAGRMPESSPPRVCTLDIRTDGVRNLPARLRRQRPASAVDTEGSADGGSAKVLDQAFSSSP